MGRAPGIGGSCHWFWEIVTDDAFVDGSRVGGGALEWRMHLLIFGGVSWEAFLQTRIFQSAGNNITEPMLSFGDWVRF